MRAKALPLVVLVVAVAALIGSVSWAATRDDDGSRSGMMSRYGSGMMGYSASGAGNHVRNLMDAKRQAQPFANELGLNVGEVMRFTNNYYAELTERNGRLATEVLVEPTNGAVYLEYGPAMMWNTRYGMMSDYRLRTPGGMMGGSGNGMMGGSKGGMMSGSGNGMMGGSKGGMMGGSGIGMMGGSKGGMMSGSGNGMMGGTADSTWTPGTTETTVSPADAQRAAQRWLDRQSSDLTAGEPDVFPGYYTLHVLRDGNVTGMISVNAATGAVWSHWWHGRFVAMLGA